MRIVLGRGPKRQEWEVSSKDAKEKPDAVNALLRYVGLVR